MTRLVALYPRAWRDRYEDEFLALMADRPPDPHGQLDIVRGAIDARLHPQVDPSRQPAADKPGPSPWRARTGWLTLLGGLLFVSAMVVAMNGPVVVDGGHVYRDGAAAFPLWFVAVILLGAGMIGVVLDLPASARAAHGAAYVAGLTGLLWAFAPWLLYAGMAALVGLAIIAASAWRAGLWSGLQFALLVAGIGAPCVVILLVGLGLWTPPSGDDGTGQFYVLGMLVTAWAVVGASLVRAPGDRPIPVDEPSV